MLELLARDLVSYFVKREGYLVEREDRSLSIGGISPTAFQKRAHFEQKLSNFAHFLTSLQFCI